MGFPTTHWSLLAKAALAGEVESQRALEELCRRYWRPVLNFLRARGIPDVEAQDLSQEFMLHVLEHSVFTRADRFRGRFRSFLIGALLRFLGDVTDRSNAWKRGGRIQHVSFDAAEALGATEAVSAPCAGTTFFDREWALTILESSLTRMRTEYAQEQREGEFTVLQNFLPGGAEPPSYEAAAAQVGCSVPALKSEIHRLRRRFRARVREEVAQTVSAPHELETEMVHLQRVLMDKGNEFGPGRDS